MTPLEQAAMQEAAFGERKPRRNAAKTTKEEAHYDQLVKAGSMPSHAAASVLMSRAKVPSQCHVHPEEKLCIDFADALRKETLEGRFKGIWGHIPNEGKRHAFTGMILRAMGIIKGSPDYFFIWYGGAGVMEAKVPGGTKQFTQKLYAFWCRANGIPHAYFHTVEEGLQQLKAWGAL